MAINMMDVLKEHKKILLPALGVLLAATVIVILITSSDFAFLNTLPVNEIVNPGKTYTQAPAQSLDATKDYTAVIQTSMGDITVNLYEDETPRTVNNFVFLANENFYDGLIFHRVIGNFVLQGGDPKGDGTGGPGYIFEDEIVSTLTFKPFVLAMANSGPGTNGSQFFITTRNSSSSHLNGKHTIFGEVTQGQDVVDKIAATRVDEDDVPIQPVIIEDIVISAN
jgi:cyclophilin family peptidyl-prolyl cis-trans isomerase